MSRIARMPVVVPAAVNVTIDGREVTVKGPKGELRHRLHALVEVEQADGELRVRPGGNSKESVAQAGTARALLANMVHGVAEGFERRLEINGVGYRAQAQGNRLNLTLGFSHPIDFVVPDGITVETPSPTEVVVRGIDKQAVGQVAANIRAFRPPEPYKGKGVKYADETIVRKEAKKA